MIITRENFEKAIRRAKAEGRKEAKAEAIARVDFNNLERNLYDSVNRLENRTIERLERVEREVGEVYRLTEALKGKCECSSESRIPIPTENPVR